MAKRERRAVPGTALWQGIPAWTAGVGPWRALFLGRGAPERDGEWSESLVPGAVDRAWLRQVHSAGVVEARPGPCGAGDALVVRRGGLAAVIATADCVPVLVAGPTAAAAVHAGWRGVAQNVVAAALDLLGPLEGATAWVGPAIGACCYEVADEVADAVVGASSPAARRSRPGRRPHLDLSAAVAAQLSRAGVGAIVRIDCCTRCHPDRLWSHRRDGESAGRNLALIWQPLP